MNFLSKLKSIKCRRNKIVNYVSCISIMVYLLNFLPKSKHYKMLPVYNLLKYVS